MSFEKYLKTFDYQARKDMKINIATLLGLYKKGNVQLIDIRFPEEVEAWSFGFIKNIPELNGNDKIQITELFEEIVMPKLIKLDARVGTINCGFAGEKYQNWNISFKSIGSDLIITEFEYDEEGFSVDFDL